MILFLSDNGPPFPGAKTNLYDAGTRNQFLAITNLPPGTYTFRMQANPDHGIQEVTEDNNVLTKSITL